MSAQVAAPIPGLPEQQFRTPQPWPTATPKLNTLPKPWQAATIWPAARLRKNVMLAPNLIHMSTSAVEPERALAYWNDEVFRSTLDIDSPARANFHGVMDRRNLGPANLLRVCADVRTVRRTQSRINERNVPGYVLHYVLDGNLGLQQGDRSVRLARGDVVLLDMGVPYLMECLTRTRVLSVVLPQDWLRTWLPVPESVCVRPFPGSPGWRAALAASLATLDAEFAEQLVLPAGAVTEQLAVLLALAAGREAQASSTSDQLFQRIQRTIRDRCHEPGLNPAAVAEEFGISRRYLHHVYASAATTFGAELMRMRLEQAGRMLSDSRFDAMAVSEISVRCGFVEPSHFARRFRRAFRLGPSQFRAARRD